MANCTTCGELTSNSRFCSRSCAATFNNKNNNRWKDIPTKKKTRAITCKNCKNIVYTNNELFCSNQCKAEFSLKEIREGKGKYAAVRNYLNNKYNACFICGISEWNDKPITLEMDHIDGDCKNNSLENCRLLCPNCHSQTDNFRIKNKGNSSRKRYQYY